MVLLKHSESLIHSEVCSTFTIVFLKRGHDGQNSRNLNNLPYPSGSTSIQSTLGLPVQWRSTSTIGFDFIKVHL